MKSWDILLGEGSCYLLLIPVILLLINYKEGRYHFLALAFYLLQIVVLNMFNSGIVPVSPYIKQWAGIWNNLLDLPLMLIFLQYYAKDAISKKYMWYLLAGFVVFELAVYLLIGMNMEALVIIIGPDLLIASGLCFYYFIDQLQVSIQTRMYTGKAFVIGGLVFGYLCFILIYIMYYLLKSSHTRDIYTIYYLTFITMSLCITIGLALIMRSRKRISSSASAAKEPTRELQYL